MEFLELHINTYDGLGFNSQLRKQPYDNWTHDTTYRSGTCLSGPGHFVEVVKVNEERGVVISQISVCRELIEFQYYNTTVRWFTFHLPSS